MRNFVSTNVDVRRKTRCGNILEIDNDFGEKMCDACSFHLRRFHDKARRHSWRKTRQKQLVFRQLNPQQKTNRRKHVLHDHTTMLFGGEPSSSHRYKAISPSCMSSAQKSGGQRKAMGSPRPSQGVALRANTDGSGGWMKSNKLWNLPNGASPACVLHGLSQLETPSIFFDKSMRITRVSLEQSMRITRVSLEQSMRITRVSLEQSMRITRVSLQLGKYVRPLL
jgi:hypothetical protein